MYFYVLPFFFSKVMAENTDIFCMDSTHKTVRHLRPIEESGKEYKSGYLFTLLVKDRVVQKSILIAFLICGSESRYLFDLRSPYLIRSLMLSWLFILITTSRYPLGNWLTWLRDSCGLRTTSLMADYLVTEQGAIKTTFHNANIF